MKAEAKISELRDEIKRMKHDKALDDEILREAMEENVVLKSENAALKEEIAVLTEDILLMSDEMCKKEENRKKAKAFLPTPCKPKKEAS